MRIRIVTLVAALAGLVGQGLSASLAMAGFEALGGRFHSRVRAHPSGASLSFEATGRIVKGQVRGGSQTFAVLVAGREHRRNPHLP